MGAAKYSVDDLDMGQYSPYEHRGYVGAELGTFGDNLKELLENAVYFLTDQDGGEVGQTGADDSGAIEAIQAWYTEQLEAEGMDRSDAQGVCVRLRCFKLRQIGRRRGLKLGLKNKLKFWFRGAD